MVKTTAVELTSLYQTQAAKMVGRSRSWVQDNLPSQDDGRYDPAVIHQWVVDDLKRKHQSKLEDVKTKYERNGDLEEIMRRKKLAEAERAERELRLADLKIARLESKLMPVDWVNQAVEKIATELRKPIEIIARNHPEYAQLIVTGLDNALDTVATMLADDQPS